MYSSTVINHNKEEAIKAREPIESGGLGFIYFLNHKSEQNKATSMRD